MSVPAFPQSIGAAGGRSPCSPDTLNTQRVDVLLHDVDPESANGRDRRLRVGRAPESRDPRLTAADRGDQNGPV